MAKSVQEMLAIANAVIDTVAVHDALEWVNEADVLFVDIREGAERSQNGTLPGALHASRGHLEFYADPQIAVHKTELASGKKLVLYCATGGRSTLASKTLVDMGLPNVINLAGGFAAWREAGGPVEPVE